MILHRQGNLWFSLAGWMPVVLSPIVVMNAFATEYMHINCLGDYTTDCAASDPDSFAQMHGTAFMIHHGPLGKLQEPPAGATTLAFEGEGKEPRFDPREDFLVFPVKHRAGRGPSIDPIWVGREEKNDVVIPDASVSSVHAYFTVGKDGTYSLQDLGSKNGSFIDNERVPSKDQGPAVELKSVSRIRFGSVTLTFLLAGDFFNLVNTFSA
jgi:hypothetical protein